MSTETASRLRDWLQRFVDEQTRTGRLRGLQAFVARHGEVLVDAAFGCRGQDDQPLTTATRMAVFSASKPVTATAVHLLAERGQLVYNDPVARHVEEFGQKNKQTITFHQCFLHQAGIPDFYMRLVPPEAFIDWKAGVAEVCALPLEYWPGTQSAYHPLTVWAIMAEAVQRLDGRAFRTFCDEEIFTPLGMTRTTWGLPPDLVDESSDTVGEGDVDDLPRRWRSLALRGALVPGGGLYTTAQDLGRFYLAMAGGGELGGRRILSPATVAHATTRHGDSGRPDSVSGMGYGFTVGVDSNRVDSSGNLGSPRQFGHSGFSVAQAWHDPADGFVAVFVVNLALDQGAGDRMFNLLSDTVHRAAP